MIVDKIFDKGDKCYFLLSSSNEPNILIPSNGIILDFKFENNNPVYQIKLNRFYDSIFFLKNHLYNMFFYTKFNQTHKQRLTLDEFDNLNDLNGFLINGNITVIVNSLMVFDNKEELTFHFNKLNFYFISLATYNLKEATTRTLYNDFLKVSTGTQFKEKFKTFIGDKYDAVTVEKFLHDIDKAKPINAIKYKKVVKKFKREKTGE